MRKLIFLILCVFIISNISAISWSGGTTNIINQTIINNLTIINGNLSDLGDVNISNKVDDDILYYNSTSDKWMGRTFESLNTIWQRIGNIISPKNSGDNLELDGDLFFDGGSWVVNGSGFIVQADINNLNAGGLARLKLDANGSFLDMIAAGSGFPAAGIAGGGGFKTSGNMFLTTIGNTNITFGNSPGGIDGDEIFTFIIESDGTIQQLGNLNMNGFNLTNIGSFFATNETGRIGFGSFVGFTNTEQSITITNNAENLGNGTVIFQVESDGASLRNHLVIVREKNNSIRLLGNSWAVITEKLVDACNSTDMLDLTDINFIYNCFNETKFMDADTANDGASLLVQGKMDVWNLVNMRKGLQLSESFDFFSTLGNDANFVNGSIHSLIPTTFISGFEIGDERILINAIFPGFLSPFINLDTNPNIWIVAANVLCDDGQCAIVTGFIGSPEITIQSNFTTLNVNETELNFVYSIDGLIGGNEFTVDINNFTGSGWVEIFSDTGTETTISQNVSIDSNYWNSSVIGLRFNCLATSGSRGCYVDTVKLNGTSMINTTASVDSFDSEICGGDGSRDINGNCNVGIRWDAETAQWIFAGTINATGTITAGIGGSGTTNNWAKFVSPTSIGNAPVSDDGSLITMTLDLLVNGIKSLDWSNVSGSQINNDFNWLNLTQISNYFFNKTEIDLMISGNISEVNSNIDGNFTELNNLKLNKTDQRYNDTDLIESVNTSLDSKINSETSNRIGNDSLLDNKIDSVNTSLISRYDDFNYNQTEPANEFTIETNNSLAEFIDNTYSRLIGGNNINGTQDFNGGWTSGGLSIIGGDIFAQTGYFYNITGLDVNTLRINGSIIPQSPFDNTFDLGSASLRWKDLHLGGDAFINGSIGIQTITPASPLEVQGKTSGAWGSGQPNTFLKIGVDGGLNTVASPGNSYGNIAIGNIQIFTDGSETATGADPSQALVIQTQDNPDADGEYIQFSIQSSGEAQRFAVIQGATGWTNQFYDSLAVGVSGETNCTAIGVNHIDCGTTTAADLYVADDIEIGGQIFIDGTGDNYFAGNVGIGTSNPISILDINSPDAIIVNLNSSGSEPQIRFINADNSKGAIIYDKDDDGLEFRINGTSASDIKMFIGYDGNVGIGTSSPSQKLDVNGTIRIGASTDTISDSLVPSHGGILLKSDAVKTRTGAIYMSNEAGEGLYINSSFGNTHINTGEFLLLQEGGGNVGIGTSSPGSSLHVSASGEIATFGNSDFNDKYILIRDDVVNGIMFGLSDANIVSSGGQALIKTGIQKGFAIKVHDGSAFADITDADFVIDTSGNVGIGTSSPTSPLHVNGSEVNQVARFESTDTKAQILLTDPTDTLVFSSNAGNGYIGFDTSVDGNNLIKLASATNYVTFPNGFVGIGTSSPSSVLQLGDNSNTPALTLAGLRTGTGGAIAQINFTNNDGGLYSSALIESYNDLGVADGDLRFHTTNAFIQSEAMRITSTGNVGIGTDTPSRILHVVDDDSIPFLSGEVNSEQIFYQFARTDATQTATLRYTGAGSLIWRKGLSGNFDFQDDSGTSALYIDASSNVGIGTSSPNELFDVKRSLTGSAGSYSGEPVMRLTQGLDSSYNIGDVHSGFEFYTSDAGGDFPGIQGYIRAVTTRGDGITNPDAGLVFGTSDGSGGLAIDRMIIDVDGNIGIGTDSPSVKLDVNGSISDDKGIIRDKQYLGNGTDFNVTGTNWATTRAVAIPYQTSDGAWRMKFNIAGTVSTAVTGLNIILSGVAMETTISQAVTLSSTVSRTVLTSRTTLTGLTGIFSATTTTWEFSGDVELDSKPTWAD